MLHSRRAAMSRAGAKAGGGTRRWALNVRLLKVLLEGARARRDGARPAPSALLCERAALASVLTGARARGGRRTQAQHLPKMDLVGSVDPYVVLRLGNTEHKSSIVKKNYSPEWHEDFVFSVSDEEREDLVLTLYDWDRMSKDDVIGCVRIEVALPARWLRLCARASVRPALDAARPRSTVPPLSPPALSARHCKRGRRFRSSQAKPSTPATLRSCPPASPPRRHQTPSLGTTSKPPPSPSSSPRPTTPNPHAPPPSPAPPTHTSSPRQAPRRTLLPSTPPITPPNPPTTRPLLRHQSPRLLRRLPVGPFRRQRAQPPRSPVPSPHPPRCRPRVT